MKSLVRCIFAILAAGLLLSAIACGASESPEPTATEPESEAPVTLAPERVASMVTRKEVLRSLTAKVILPGYEAVAQAMAQMEQAVDALCWDAGGPALEAAQDDWRAARQAWLRTESYRFGPAMDRRSASLVDWWPIDTAKVDRNLESGEPFTKERVSEFLAATQRGLGAAEYLLFGIGSANLSDAQEDGPRCSYLRSVVGVAAQEAAGILTDWQGSGDGKPYAGYFDGSASLALLDSEAEAEVVRTLVFQVRSIANMRLGAALGIDGEADASAIPAGDANNSREDLLSQLEGIAAVYRGGDSGLGVSARVASVSSETDARMMAAIDETVVAARNLDGSVIELLESDPSQVKAVYDSMKGLQLVLNTEVVSVLGVSVGFADTDGDS